MPEEAATTEPVVSAPVETAPVETPAAAADPFDSPDTTQFSREYVEKLRKENAAHRTANAPYKEAFDAYGDEDKAVWLDLAKSIASDPKTGAQKMLDIAQALLEAGDTAGAEKVIDAAAKKEGEPEYLTADQLTKAFDERDKAAKLEAETKAIVQEAVALGYEENTPDYDDLMSHAIKYHNYDLKAAHEAREAARQKIIDDFVASKGVGAKVIGAAGAAIDHSTSPKTMEEAGAATRARLKAARAAAAS